MVETKDFFKGNTVCWDDVSHLGEMERNAIILDEGEFHKSKYSDRMDLIITIQMITNKEIFRFRLNKKTHNNLKQFFGTETKNWREKKVKIVPLVYGNNKTGIELRVIDEQKPLKQEFSFDDVDRTKIIDIIESFKGKGI